MVQLNSLPFQWHGAPENEFYNVKDKKSICAKKQSATRLFLTLSKQKLYAKKALERFRIKINTVPESRSSSLAQRIMSSVSAVWKDSPLNRESSICISKRASVCQTFNQGSNKYSDILDTDMLFKNAKYGDMMQVSSDDIHSHLMTESSDITNFLEKEFIVSRNSENKSKVTRQCKCDVYDDLQRKWEHVKKSFSELPGTRHPLSMLKNFCSSLFGPSCTMETCQNRRERNEREKSAKRTKTEPQSILCKDRKAKTDHKMACKELCANLAAECQTQTQTDRQTQLADEEEVVEAIKNAMCAQEKAKLEDCLRKEDERMQPEVKVHKGIQIVVRPDMTTRHCQAVNYANYCHQEAQYEKQYSTGTTSSDPKTYDPKTYDPKTYHLNTFDPPTYDPKIYVENEADKAVGSFMCLCDEAVQMLPHNEICTCATQHSGIKVSNMRYRPVNKMVVNEMKPVSPVVNKKTQHTSTELAYKGTLCIARKHYKKGKDVKTGVSAVNQKLSLESSLLLNRCTSVANALNDELTDYTITDSSNSSISLRSDESKTDTTICGLATFNYDDTPRRRKYRLKVVTKQNQSTLTDKTQVCDTGTITHDWWSPLIERKANNPILLEKKKGFNLIEKQKKELRELKEWRELRDVRKRMRNGGLVADGRNVAFRSRTQIIPTAIFPGGKDIMSPSRYLLESQKYYNELFAYNYRPRPQAAYNYVTQIPKYHEKEKSRSTVGSRRNHHRKMKRLDECYSPKQQLSPRKRKTESTRTSDSPRRKTSHRQYRQTNNRNNSKNNTPRKRV